MSFVPCWLESFFFIQRVDFGFLFSTIWMLEVLYWKNWPIILIHIVIAALTTICILISLWHLNKHAETMLLFSLLSFFFFFKLSWICYLHGTGRLMLLNFLQFCLYCMYFFKGFGGRPLKSRSACERGRACIVTGYPQPPAVAVVCCALVLLKHPIKHTVVGLWNRSAVCASSVFTDRGNHRLDVFDGTGGRETGLQLVSAQFIYIVQQREIVWPGSNG